MPAASIQHAASRLIRKLESIATLSAVERMAILDLPMRLETFAARQDVVRDGLSRSRCFLVVDGWTCSYKLLSEGKRQILSFHVPGDIPDLQGLNMRTADHGIATLQQATVAFIPHESLHEVTALHPGLAAALMRHTLIDAAVSRAWLVGMGRRPAYDRIAHLFCELYLKLKAVGLAGDHRCPLPVTQVDLADALGLTSVHVNRVLKEMRGKAVITLRGHMLAIKAWNELLGASEFDPTYLHLKAREVEGAPAACASAGTRHPPRPQWIGFANDGVHVRSE